MRSPISGVFEDALGQLLVKDATLLVHLDDGLACIVGNDSARFVKSERLLVGQWHVARVLGREG